MPIDGLLAGLFIVTLLVVRFHPGTRRLLAKVPDQVAAPRSWDHKEVMING